MIKIGAARPYKKLPLRILGYTHTNNKPVSPSTTNDIFGQFDIFFVQINVGVQKITNHYKQCDNSLELSI